MPQQNAVSPTSLTRAAGFGLLVVIWRLPVPAAEVPIAARPLAGALRAGVPDGWQYRTLPRVLIPVGVQLMLSATFGTVAMLLLSRPHGEMDRLAPDVRAAAVAAEAVVLLAFIWVLFQGMRRSHWRSSGSARARRCRSSTSPNSAASERRSLLRFAPHRRLGRPELLCPFEASHWRLGQLLQEP